MPRVAIYISDKIPKARVNPVPDRSRLPNDCVVSLHHSNEGVPSGTEFVVCITNMLGENQRTAIAARAKDANAKVAYASRASWSAVHEALTRIGLRIPMARATSDNTAAAPAKPSMLGMMEEALEKADMYNELVVEAQKMEADYFKLVEENEQLKKAQQALDRQVNELQKDLLRAEQTRDALQEKVDANLPELHELRDLVDKIHEMTEPSQAPHIREVGSG